MGKEFGNLQKVSGIIYYVLSPHEVKPFTGIINPGIKNTIRRFQESVLWLVIPGSIIYIAKDLVQKEYERTCRKDPADYIHDV